MPNNLKILLVEDNPGDARLIQEMLNDSQPNHWELFHANNLFAGLEKIYHNSINVILLDLGLPDSQGLDALVKITSTAPHLPVIILTGMKDSDTAIEAMQAGAQDYLIKGDFTSDSLVRVIRYAIERKQVEAELQKNRQLLREAERLSHTGAWEWDLKSGILIMSDEWMRIHGVEKNTFVADELMEIAHPDDAPAVRLAWNAVFENHVDYNMEHRIIRQNDREERIIQAYGQLINDQEGNPLKLIGVARDITERKQAEEKIRFQAYCLEAVEQAVIVTRLDGEIIYWNPFAAQLYGWSAEEAMGRNIVEVTVPQMTQDQAADIMAKLGAGESWAGEFLVQHWDGRTFPAFVSDTPLYNDQGELFAIIGISFDITELKQIEQALRESEKKYKTLVETASDAIYLMSEDGHIIDTNQCACDMLGKTREEIVGSMIDSVDPNYPIDGFLEFWGNVPYNEQHIFETTHLRKDGSLIPIEISGKKYQLNEKTYYYGVARNIAERKQAEETLRRSEASLNKAQEVSNVGSWTWHIPANELIWSDQLYKIFGVNQKEFTGDLFELINKSAHPDDIERINRIHRAVAETGEPTPYELRIIWPDGTERTLYSEAGECIRDEQGNPQTISGITQDITERKQMELALQEERNLLAQRVEERTAELRRANDELLQAMQTKDDFLANMSHELRTPLTAILGVSEILEMGIRGPLNEEQIHSVRTIYQSGEHLLNLINDILDLSKIEAGKLVIEPTEVLIEDICIASLSLVQGMAFAKDLEMTSHIAVPDLKIRADARRLKQILVNLLSNAVKFTPNGGKVSLSVEADRQKNQIKFMVTDNGIGIAQNEIRKLFQPFSQLDSSLSRQYEGTGLGLALVKRLVELHHGEVAIESKGIPGEGSCFTVVLPFDAGAILPVGNMQNQNTAAVKLDGTPVTNTSPVSEKPKLILLAEDNPDNAATMMDYLQQKGFAVILAKNGVEAVEMAKSSTPDLFLMDIQMPVMDGLEAIRLLRQDRRFTLSPILALTALAMPGDRQRCLDAGATDYLTKPVKLKELLEKINACLHSPDRPPYDS